MGDSRDSKIKSEPVDEIVQGQMISGQGKQEGNSFRSLKDDKSNSNDNMGMRGQSIQQFHGLRSLGALHVGIKKPKDFNLQGDRQEIDIGQDLGESREDGNIGFRVSALKSNPI